MPQDSMAAEVESLRRRIATMERKWRMSGLLWLGSIVIVAVLWIGAQRAVSQTNVVKTSGVDIVDSAGKVRLSLGLSQRGNGALWLYDASGRNRAFLGFSAADPPTPMVVLNDEREAARLYMGWTSLEKQQFATYDNAGKVAWSSP